MTDHAVAPTDARAARGAETRARILAETRAALGKLGQELTLDDIAARLGLTRQAVLYHFPSKDRLMVELALLGITEESDAMIAALVRARSAADAVRRFLRASLAFHLGDLERFRLIYVRAQVVPGAKITFPGEERKVRLYPVTSRMYSALEEKLSADPKFPSDLNPRTLAVAVHLAAIGYATMAGELKGARDTMKFPFERYVDELASAIGRGFSVGVADKIAKRRRSR
jgi:AcrR family transcriptional regulator